MQKGFEQEKRDITKEVKRILDSTWLPWSVRKEIAINASKDYDVLAERDADLQEKKYEDELKKEAEKQKKEGE